MESVFLDFYLGDIKVREREEFVLNASVLDEAVLLQPFTVTTLILGQLPVNA
jgi:hypothetical protein